MKNNKREFKKKKQSDLGKAWSYISESRSFIYSISIVFVFSIFLGFVFADKLTNIEEILNEILMKIQGLDGIGLIFFILQNNLQESIYALIFGAVFGIFPILNALSNGVVLGYVLNKVYLGSGIVDFWRILPHGIFEIPAVLISMGLGVKLGFFIFSRNKKEELKRRFFESIRVFLFVVVPLLIVAAIIEGILIIIL